VPKFVEKYFMSFVIISADFPGVRTEEMSEIYKRLKSGSWEQRHDHDGAINTTWMTSFVPGILESEAIKIAQVSFMACCKPYCPPILVIQWENNEPIPLDAK
jgi:hypothetical protein